MARLAFTSGDWRLLQAVGGRARQSSKFWNLTNFSRARIAPIKGKEYKIDEVLRPTIESLKNS